MNGLDYGSRIPPLLRFRIHTLVIPGAAWGILLPPNPHRFSLLPCGWHAANNNFNFGPDTPTESGGLDDCSQVGMAAICRYCDLGPLIWERFWGKSIDAADNVGRIYEWTLPQEGWEILLKQGLMLGRPS